MAKPAPRILTVKKTQYISPNMIRVTLTGPELHDFPEGHEGANCKILIPELGQTKDAFATQIGGGQKPVTRTYTIRHYRKELSEVDIDFVVHGDHGPACSWASNAKPGGFLGVRGPGSPAKVTYFEADFYILAADMSALPVVSATLETMPENAKGIAIFEILSEDDKQKLTAPEGIEQHWIVHSDPDNISSKQLDKLKQLDWPEGRIQTCIAGESNAIKDIRHFLLREKKLPNEDVYISGYWKIGLIEDQHQKIKRLEAEI